MGKMKEPAQLARGRAFHRKVQAAWKKTAEETVTVEKSVTKPGGSRGRIDVHAQSDGVLVGVAELKASDWDRMTESAVRRNVVRQIRQVWTYVESELSAGHEVSPGIVFQASPRSEQRRALIESLFEAECIAVVWEDETVTERKARS